MVWLLVECDCNGPIETEVFSDANKAKEVFLKKVISYTIDTTMHNMTNEELTGVEDIYKFMRLEEKEWFIDFGLTEMWIEEKEIK